MATPEIEHLIKNADAKRIIKEAIDEWLDKKFSEFGKWSAYGLLAAIVAVALYMTLVMNGWHKI